MVNYKCQETKMGLSKFTILLRQSYQNYEEVDR